MKRILFFLVIACMICSCAGKPELRSPSGNLQIHFRLSDSGSPAYCVMQGQDTLIAWSALGFNCAEQDLTQGFTFRGIRQRSHDETWQTVWGEERLIRDNHREMTVSLAHQSGIKMDIVFRAFDDGIALRYVFPEQETARLSVTNEATEYRFVADHEAWSIPWLTEYYEGIWTKEPLSQKDTMCSPVTLELCGGGYAFVHEAALTNYPAQNLYMNDGALRTYLTPWLDADKTILPVRAFVDLPFNSPWRFVIVTPTLPQMVASRIMLNLNDPCRIDDTSWIKPMKFLGIWWGMHLKTMTWEQGPIHGATTADMERYLRFAAEHNIEAVLAEGWNKGWEDWKHFSFTEPYDDWDMPYLSRLADSLGVQIVGHNETGGNAADYEAVLDEAYAYHAAHGIHAIKTGYVSPIIRTPD